MGIDIDIGDFFECRLPTIDVRSPAEFQQGHIPDALNVPLFDDGERAEIGTIYKQIGRREAISRGLDVVAVKAGHLVGSVRTLVREADFVLHCWRGGMRSEGFAWLLEQSGFRPRILQGGYKVFRRAAHACFAQPHRIILLSGHSGAGKTRLLHDLREQGQQVIDLEHLAGHRGSVFGGIGQPPQPTVEQFENQLFLQWRDLDPTRPVWIEGESRVIGKVFLPEPVWNQMTNAPAIVVEVERKQRVEFLVGEYGHLPADELARAIQGISKRLGGARLRAALDALNSGDLHTFADHALEYYDKAYAASLQKRPHDLVIRVPLSSPDQPDSVRMLSRLGNELTTRLPAGTDPLVPSPAVVRSLR